MMKRTFFLLISPLFFISSGLYAQRGKGGFPTGRVDSLGQPIYGFIQQLPVFKGDFRNYQAANLRYPDSARRRGEEGNVKVKFAIDRKGYLFGLEVEKSSGYPLLDSEALRIFRPMQTTKYWRPGKNDGIRGPVYMTQRINFKLD